jgi:hypothetical protein
LICEDSKDLHKSEDHWIGGQLLFEGSNFYKNGDIFNGLFLDASIKRGTFTFAEGGNFLDISENIIEFLYKML